jgi:hypothetical protein
MKKSNFTLIPFSINTAPALNITSTISRQYNQLNLQYLLTGNLETIIIPQAVTAPTRQYNLWEHTCIEFFLGLQDSNTYWEFNLSPAGDWNVFRFPNYRQDIAEEKAFTSLPFTVLQQADYLQLNLEIDLNKIISSEQNLAVGITNVIESQAQQLGYWALKHPESTADFHHRDSWIIKL